MSATRSASGCLGIRHHGPGSARSVAGRARAARARRGLHRGPAGGRGGHSTWPPTRRWSRRSRCWPTTSTIPPRPRSGRSPASARSGRRCGGRSATAGRSASSTCRPPSRWPRLGRRRATARRRAYGRPAGASWPRPRATTTPSAGGTTWSSTGRTTCSRPSPRRWRPCARTGPSASRAGRRSARPTCAAACGRSRTRASSGSRWCAAPGTCRRWPTSDATSGRPRTPRCCRGLPSVKVAMTWVPWSSRRLAAATGYGAGVRAPGWYHHLFRHAGPDVIARWFCEVAAVLRRWRAHPASPAQVIDATRLADALATLRRRPLAGLTEVTEAAAAVLGEGRLGADGARARTARGRHGRRRRARPHADGAPWRGTWPLGSAGCA